MEKELKNYKIATWVLASIAIVMTFWVIRLKTQDAETGVEAVTATLQKCSDDLSSWREVNPDPKKASAVAQEELSNILKACAGNTGDQADETTIPQ